MKQDELDALEAGAGLIHDCQTLVNAVRDQPKIVKELPIKPRKGVETRFMSNLHVLVDAKKIIDVLVRLSQTQVPFLFFLKNG